jgi:hypothetical protein
VSKRKKSSQTRRNRVGSKARQALLEERKQLSEHHNQLVEQRSRFVSAIEGRPIEMIRTPDGSEIKVRCSDPMIDRMDWDNEREIAYLKYKIRKIEELLNPARGRPRESIYELAFRDQHFDPSLTVAHLAEKYLPIYFPERKDSAIGMMRQGLRRVRRRKH